MFVGLSGELWCSMTFTGTYCRTIDEKCRVAIPKSIRAVLGEGVEVTIYLAPGTNDSLNLYTEEGFERLAKQLAGVSPTGADVRAFSRLFYGQAQRVTVDRQGRVRVPGELALWAGLKREVVLLGVRDHLELWDRGRWEIYRDETKPRYDEIAASAFRSGP
jgi:MraZ protein